eukprot:TRINITY_DN16655_c0_g1_i1.p1 TRINITY_DN16655_c0_g1~~TRINITY_DN16655_c0_g1_i1.p1  ORF type:complete len:1727 (+),score=273.95 TRINITY_DN16655_c0_g1_i1:34-5214(+)
MGRGGFAALLSAATVALGDLPACPVNYDSCIARRVGVTFADTWRSIGNGKPLTDPLHKGSVCREQTWVDLMTCQSNPMLQFEVTAPAAWRGAKLLLKETQYTPLVAEAHIDALHPLHGQELEVASLGDLQTGFGFACSAEEADSVNVTGKVVFIGAYGCPAGGGNSHTNKVRLLEARGAAGVVVVQKTDRLELQTQTMNMVGTNTLAYSKRIPYYASTACGGEQIMHQAYRGGGVRGRFLVRCGSNEFDDTPSNEYFDGCGTGEWSAKDMNGCEGAARPADRICARCPTVAHFVGGGTSVCLFGNYLLPFRYKNSMLNQTRSTDSANITSGSMTYLGGKLPHGGCNESDYANYSGKVVVVDRAALSCHLYHAVYVAQLAGVRAVWHIGVPEMKTTDVLSGNSYMIDIPVHSVGTDDTLAFLNMAQRGTADANGHMHIADDVRLVKGELPAYLAPEEEAEYRFPSVVVEDVSSVDYEVAVPCIILIIVLALAIIVYAVKLIQDVRLGVVSGVLGDAGDGDVPLGLVSTGISLAMLCVVVTVTFSLVHAAGRTSTDTAVSDGNDGVNMMHTAALRNTRAESARWLDLLSQAMVTQVHTFFNEPIMSGLLLSKQFSEYDGTWDAFAAKVDDVRAHARSSLWDLALRLDNGFYVKTSGWSPHEDLGYFALFLNDPDEIQVSENSTISESSNGWASDRLLKQLNYPNGVYRAFARYTTAYIPYSRQIGGEWLTHRNVANDLLRPKFTSSMRRPMHWFVSRISYDTRQTNLFLLPMSVFFPIFSGSVYQGSLELSRDVNVLADNLAALMKDTAGTENVTAVLMTEDGTMLFVHTEHAQMRLNVVDIRHHAYMQGYGYYTLDNVRQPHLNAYGHYLEEAYGSLLGTRQPGDEGSVLHGKFDQAEYYKERSAWTVYRSDLATGAVMNVDRASDFFSNCTGDSCVAFRGGRRVVALDGHTHVALSYNMSGHSWLADQARTSAPGAPYESDWELFNGSRVVLENGKLGFNFTVDRGGGLLKHPGVVYLSHTVAMWVRPAVPVGDDAEPAMSAPTLFTDSHETYYARFYTNAVLKLGSLRYGCATEPIAGGPPVGVWTHMAYSVSREERMCRVYVNGTLHSESRLTLDFVGKLPLLVGLTWEPYRIGANFAGELDEVLILNTSVPDMQVARIMDGGRFSWQVDSRAWAFVQRFVQIEGSPPLRLSLAILIPQEDVVRIVAHVNHLTRLNLAVLSSNTDKKLDRNLTTSALVVVLICLVVMLAFMQWNALLLGPVTAIAEQLAAVAEFRVENIRERKTVVAEFAILNRAMAVVVANMKEYKSYMPKTLGLDAPETDGEDSSTATNSRSRSHSGSLRIQGLGQLDSKGSGSGGHNSASASFRREMSDLHTGLFLLTKRYAFLMANLVGFHVATETVPKCDLVLFHADVLDAVLSVFLAHRGVPEQFLGDRFSGSFNGASQNVCYRESVLRAIADLCNLKFFGLPDCPLLQPVEMRVAAANGTGKVGNLGSAAMRKFTHIGPLVGYVWDLERYAMFVGERNLVDEFTLQRGASHFKLVDAVMHMKRLSRPILVFAVMKVHAEEANEWMYNMEKSARANPWTQWNEWVEGIIGIHSDKIDHVLMKEKFEHTRGYQRFKPCLAGSAYVPYAIEAGLSYAPLPETNGVSVEITDCGAHPSVSGDLPSILHAADGDSEASFELPPLAPGPVNPLLKQAQPAPGPPAPAEARGAEAAGATREECS